jgi:hypothetical protein
MKIQLACEGKRNVINGKTYSYMHKPVRSGKWMSITEFSVVNCFAQEIELRQEVSGGSILSSFGTHNVSITSENIIVNHNTIVWHRPSAACKNPHNCEQKGQFQRTGRLRRRRRRTENDRKRINTKSNERARLLDLEKPIEILFNPIKTNICTTSQIAYKITGIPDTYLVFDEEVQNTSVRRLNQEGNDKHGRMRTTMHFHMLGDTLSHSHFFHRLNLTRISKARNML